MDTGKFSPPKQQGANKSNGSLLLSRSKQVLRIIVCFPLLPAPTSSQTVCPLASAGWPQQDLAPPACSETPQPCHLNRASRSRPKRKHWARTQQVFKFSWRTRDPGSHPQEPPSIPTETPSTPTELSSTPARQAPFTADALQPMIQTWRQRPSTRLAQRDPEGQAVRTAAEDVAEAEVVELAAMTGAERGIVCLMQQQGSNPRNQVRNWDEGGFYRVADEIERALRWQIEETLKKAVG